MKAFVAIVVTFTMVSLAYNVLTPAGEGVDEISHLQYTLYLKDHHALPVLPFVATNDTVLMGYHPPLYYAVAALILAPLDTDDLTKSIVRNPHFVWIEGYGPGNRNVYLHSPVTGQDPLPYQGVVLAIHVLRLASTLQGIAALLVIRELLRRVLAGRKWLIITATAAVAFQPTFVNTFSVAQNDGTVALLVLLGLLWCVRYTDASATGAPAASPIVGGLILGTALLVKETTLAIGPVYAVAIGLVALRTRRWAQSLVVIGQASLTSVLVAGWWYARNTHLYGDPLARTVYTTLYESTLHTGPYTWGHLLAFLSQLQRNYWGAFGYVHILTDPQIGNTLWLAVLVAIPGFVVALARRVEAPGFGTAWLLAGTASASFIVLFVQWSTIAGGGAAHARYFAAIIPILTAATILGLAQYTPKKWPLLPLAFAAGVVVFGASAPLTIIIPAYRPVIATADQLGAAKQVGAIFGGELELKSVQFTPDHVAPGDTAMAAFHWAVRRPTESDLRFRVRAIARDGTAILDKEIWPAGGGVPTSTWPVGITYRDVVPIVVPTNTAPGRASVFVSVQNANGDWLDIGGAGDLEVGRLAVAEVPTIENLPPGATPTSAVFGDRIALAGYQFDSGGRPGGSLGVNLLWKATNTLSEDATVSVQVLSARGDLVAQDDSEPAQGRAPTSTWPKGALVTDKHLIPLPPDLAPGEYRVIVALYTRPSLARLSVVDAGVPQDYLRLRTLTISEGEATLEPR